MSEKGETLAERVNDVGRLMGEVMPGAEDENEVQKALVARILSAETVGEAFVDLSTTATKDLLGRMFRIDDARLMRSELEDSRGVYMLLDCEYLDTGEKFVANTGATQIMGTVWACKMKGFLPIEVTVAEAKAAKPGRSAPLKLVPIGRTLEAANAS